MRKIFVLLFAFVLTVGMAFAQEPAASGQTADPNASQTADPNAGQTAEPVDQDAAAQDAGQADDADALPQTASPLPLLALLGMGGLVGGAIARRK